jgi:hypothetical protein
MNSRTYVARLDDGRRGNWEPLIDDDLFERVQARIARHREIPRQASGRYLLTGFLRCPACGGRMGGAARGRRPAMYDCRSEELGAAPTVSTCRYSASVAKLDRLARTQVAELLDVVGNADQELRTALQAAWGALGRPDDEAASLARSYEQAAAKARERIKRLALLFADQELDREGYDLGRAQAQADLAAAEAELDKLRPSEPEPALPSLDELLSRVGGWRDILAGDDIVEQREVLAMLVSRVTCERIGFGRFTVSLKWSPTGERLRRACKGATGGGEAP